MGDGARVRKVQAETRTRRRWSLCTCTAVAMPPIGEKNLGPPAVLLCSVPLRDAAPGPGSSPDFVCDPVLIQPWRV